MSTAMNAPATLRTLAGVPSLTHIDPASTALLLIDFQREYLDGALPLPEVQAAAARAQALLELAARHEVPVFHVHHVAGHPAASLFRRDASGAAPMPGLEPRAGQVRIEKGLPSAFAATALEAELRARGCDTLLIAGLMTHMCVDSTARDAVHRGFRVALAADACATRDLPHPLGGVVAHAAVHAATLAALADRFAEVTTVDDLARCLAAD